MAKKVRVVVIGSGPAGLTAALYTARAQVSTVVITGIMVGGQIATTDDVDNFPGFPDGITGPELTGRMQAQAERFGATFDYDLVTEVDFAHGSPFLVKTQSSEYLADSVIVTIGASPRKLGVPGEHEFTGRGVSYCATCDGWFFRQKDIIVAGGGDSALQEAIFLTRFANSVTVVHRRDTLRASTALQTRAFANPKISFIYDTVIDSINGDPALKTTKSVTLRSLKTGDVTEKLIDGVFIFIGYDPNSTVFGTQLKTDAAGYVIVDQHMRTNIGGVFAGGEIHDDVFRQAITAAGQGCAAALMSINWLGEHAETLQVLDDANAPAIISSGKGSTGVAPAPTAALTFEATPIPIGVIANEPEPVSGD
ncbi:MAG: thioredoxin-disulfide reductase [Chloroflexota bacterium]|nr:thioredoxin-disulfide reductase [Chloroflexota bacterium]